MKAVVEVLSIVVIYLAPAIGIAVFVLMLHVLFAAAVIELVRHGPPASARTATPG